MLHVSVFFPFLLPSSPLRLTVTDADGAHSIAYANVTVLPEKDYPPVANAEGPLLIYLPKDEVYLYGNKSTDDKVTLFSTVNCPSRQRGEWGVGAFSCSVTREAGGLGGIYHMNTVHGYLSRQRWEGPNVHKVCDMQYVLLRFPSFCILIKSHQKLDCEKVWE